MEQMVFPRVQAMVLCDEIVESDDEPDVNHLTGVRAFLEAPGFPAVRAQLCVFLQMSGHQGKVACRVEIEEIATGDVVAETEEQTVLFAHPAEVVPVYFRMPNCVFPASGLY